MKPTYPQVDPQKIEQAKQTLLNGGLVAIPTETVYGLAADADNEAAVNATFEAKGRPKNHPLIVHVDGIDAVDFWAKDVPPEAWLLAQTFWPGPLTIVLKKKDRCGEFVTGGQDSVALRCPSHPWTQALLKALAGADHKGLTAPSANAFGRISPTSAKHVAEDLGVKPNGKLDMILDGGTCMFGIESTMVDCSNGRPTILRHGIISRAELEKVLGFEVPDAGSDAPRASGRLKSHYAPKTKLVLLDSEEFVNAVESFEGKAAVMARRSILEKIACETALEIEAPEQVVEYARILYEALHQLDDSNADRIFIEMIPDAPEWRAVLDRLSRAAA